MNKASIVLSTDDLEKVCSAFTIANGAAASGMEVVMFFSCWGVNVVKKKGLRLRGDNLANKAMNFLSAKGADRLRLSRYNFLGLGSWLMRRNMKAKNIQSIPEMIADAKELGVRMMVCDNPVAIMGLKKEDFVDEVEGLVGVATYVKESAGCELSLFI